MQRTIRPETPMKEKGKGEKERERERERESWMGGDSDGEFVNPSAYALHIGNSD